VDIGDDETEAISSGKANEELTTGPDAHHGIAHEKNDLSTTPYPAITETVGPTISDDTTIHSSSLQNEDAIYAECGKSDHNNQHEEMRVYEDSMIDGVTTQKMVRLIDPGIIAHIVESSCMLII
jgi:hypothetical protein